VMQRRTALECKSADDTDVCSQCDRRECSAASEQLIEDSDQTDCCFAQQFAVGKRMRSTISVCLLGETQ
jgi:hypothetical protein